MSEQRAGASKAAFFLFGTVAGAMAVLLTVEVPEGHAEVAWGVTWAALLISSLVAAFAGRERRPPPPDGGGAAAGPADTVRPSRTGAVRATAAVVLCLVLGGGTWAFWPEDESKGKASGASAKGGEKPRASWKVPSVGNRDDEGPGAWGLGDSVVRGRVDGLSSYSARDGAERWTLPAPAREAVCAMSPEAEQGIGLIAYGRHYKPCATLVAVRVSDGKALWQRSLKGEGLIDGGAAVGGTTAVTAEDGALRARSAGTGEQLWQRPLGKECAARAVDATSARTLLVEQCGTGARLIALDTRTGEERWTRDLPVESITDAAVVSVTPAVLAVSEEDQRGTHALLGFDDRGAPTATVPLSGPAGELVAPESIGRNFGGQGRPLVLGDLLITLAERDGLWADVVVAHSLKDGREMWEHRAAGSLYGLAPMTNGRVGVLTESGDEGHIILLNKDGAERGLIEPEEGRGGAVSTRPELIPVTGGHVVVNHLSMSGEPALFSLP
ncbi:PQQ-binding-like beta-propeller repeat protein [Streptomyces amakusaensis]|uniref:PQQ-binding-like beta-propeller repeat protein n=1 Tax=Streptomyces amakusaensis TaxID=67271 RepID=A0ABW0ASR6_9ACTN